jgi:hypothetical protein
MDTNTPPTKAPATPGKDPAPLGPHPSSEKVLDVAVQYTFPASDPTAVGASVHAAEEEGEPAPVRPAAPIQRGDFEWPRSPRR